MVDREEKLEAFKEFCHLGEMLSAEGRRTDCSNAASVPGVSLAISTTSHQRLSAISVLTLGDMYSKHYFEPRHEKTCFLHISIFWQ